MTTATRTSNDNLSDFTYDHVVYSYVDAIKWPVYTGILRLGQRFHLSSANRRLKTEWKSARLYAH